jgi:hypothetical protein
VTPPFGQPQDDLINDLKLQSSELSLYPNSVHTNLALSVLDDAGIVMNLHHLEPSLREQLHGMLCSQQMVTLNQVGGFQNNITEWVRGGIPFEKK